LFPSKKEIKEKNEKYDIYTSKIIFIIKSEKPLIFDRRIEMKNRKAEIIWFIFIFICIFVGFKAMPVFASTTGTDTNGFTWQSDDGVTYSITGYNGSDTNITIPSSIDGHTVTSIGNNAFKDKSLTSVTIPDTVTSIGSFAFYNCLSLVNISIPDSVTSIGDSAFAYCTSLPNITLPPNLSSIGNSTFQYCQALTAITIPSSVTSIGSFAFYYCSSLVSISIPDSVTNIGDSAFAYCISLPNITLPANLNSIGNSTFQDCKAFTEITIPNSVTRIGDHAFFECEKLTNITIPNSVTSIGESAFQSCKVLNNVVIPDSVTSVGDYLFYDCWALTNVKLSNNITKISDFMFYRCWKLSDITLPNGITGIGYRAFEECEVLTNITIPNSVLTIGGRAFLMCKALQNITIPNSVKTIDFNAFAHCYAFTKIVIPDSVTSIGDYAFYYCTSLTEVTIPQSVTDIGFLTFDSCNSNFKIKGSGGSYPQTYANNNSLAFQELNAINDTVTFNSEGGSAVGSVQADNNTLITSPVKPSKAGYTFGGWYKELACITPWNFTTDKVTSNITLYAKWIRNPVTPVNIKSVTTGYNAINTSWSTVAGASGYELYRANSSTGTYSLVKATTSLNFVNTGLVAGTTYYYKVRTYVLDGTTKVYSDYSPIVSAKLVPTAPTGVKSTSTGYSSINTNWNAVVGASGYELYRASSSNGTYSLVKATTSLNFVNTGLVAGTTYYYKVRDYVLNGTTKVYSGYSPIVSAKPVPFAPTGVKTVSTGYNSIRSSWNAVAGANGYELYRASSTSGTYSLVKATTSLNFVNTGLITGKTYYYRVKAYRLVGTTKIYGGYSPIASARTVPAAPTRVKSTATGHNRIRTSWNAVTGASGYALYRASSGNGKYNLIKATTSLSFVNKGLIRGKTYYFKVRAYRFVGTTKVYSNLTSAIHTKTY
jgi:uncharacterized repeat protein (TIGR02543 family)